MVLSRQTDLAINFFGFIGFLDFYLSSEFLRKLIVPETWSVSIFGWGEGDTSSVGCLVQWLRLTLSKGTHSAHLSLYSLEDGNRSSYRTLYFIVFRIQDYQKRAIPSYIRHSQTPLDSSGTTKDRCTSELSCWRTQQILAPFRDVSLWFHPSDDRDFRSTSLCLQYPLLE
jgi:hypothetical protein